MDIISALFLVGMLIVIIFCGMMLLNVSRRIDAFEKSMEDFDKSRKILDEAIERLTRRYTDTKVTDTKWRR